MNFVEIQWIKSLLICSNKPLFLLCYTVQSRFYASINLAVHIKLPDVILCLHPHGYCGLRTQNQTELIFIIMIGRKQKPQTWTQQRRSNYSLWKLDSKGSSHRKTSAHWWTNTGWKQVLTRFPSPLWVLTPATVYFYSLHSAPSTLCWCDLAYSDWALRGQPAPIGGLPWLHEIFIKQHKHAPSARRQRDASCLVTSERWPKSWRLSVLSGKTQHGSARGGPTHAGVCSLIVVLLVLSMNWTRLTLSLRRTAATLFCRLSHLWFPSWTMTFSLLAASVRFSRARRRYCLLTSSSWVRRSWTCRWNAWEDDIKEEKSSECDANASLDT